MKMNRLILLAAGALTLASCGNAETSSTSSSEDSSAVEEAFRYISPTGAPSLAFYDKGEDSNWISTSTPATDLVPSFKTQAYDAIVFDGFAGLSQIRNAGESSTFVLARWINELPFYVVSVKHSSLSEYEVGQTIDAFVETGNASRALRVLHENVWGKGALTKISDETGSRSVTYEAGVAEVNSKLQANPEAYDYFVLAEPVYTSAMAALKAKGITLNLIVDLQSEWSNAFDGAKIPSAGLFINKNSLVSKPNGTKEFLSSLDKRLFNLSNAPEIASDALKAYIANHPSGTDEKDLATRFGVQEQIANNLPNLQKTNKFGFFQHEKEDGLGYFKVEDNMAYANGFASNVGVPEFSSSYFLSE